MARLVAVTGLIAAQAAAHVACVASHQETVSLVTLLPALFGGATAVFRIADDWFQALTEPDV
jgi:hypothetical protein